jgi:hypothetical protein
VHYANDAIRHNLYFYHCEYVVLFLHDVGNFADPNAGELLSMLIL